MNEDKFPIQRRILKPNVITSGQFIAPNNSVHPTATSVIVTGVNNSVCEGANNVSVFNSSGCTVYPNVRGATLINCSGTIVSENDQTYVNGSLITSVVKQTYKANISQTGTDDPIVIVFENTFGGEIIWTRIGFGNYIGTLIGAFGDQTVMYLTIAPYAETEYIMTGTTDSIQVLSKIAGVPTDDSLFYNSIEITRYQV